MIEFSGFSFFLEPAVWCVVGWAPLAAKLQWPGNEGENRKNRSERDRVWR